MSLFEKRDERGGCRGFMPIWPICWLFAFFMPLIMFLSSVVGLVPIDEPWEDAIEDSLMRRCPPGMSMPSLWEVEDVLLWREGRRSTGFKGWGVTFWLRLSHLERSAHWRDSVHWRDSEGFMLVWVWKALAVMSVEV